MRQGGELCSRHAAATQCPDFVWKEHPPVAMIRPICSVLVATALALPVLYTNAPAHAGGWLNWLRSEKPAAPTAPHAPGGLYLGQPLDEAKTLSQWFYYGNTCYGELAVSGDVMTRTGLAHVMGYVDKARTRIEALEVNFARTVETGDRAGCEKAVRTFATWKFPGMRWNDVLAGHVFLGRADRVILTAETEDTRVEVWGDLSTLVRPTCLVSWRASLEERRFDPARPLSRRR